MQSTVHQSKLHPSNTKQRRYHGTFSEQGTLAEQQAQQSIKQSAQHYINIQEC
jgi:hypothetical protein